MAEEVLIVGINSVQATLERDPAAVLALWLDRERDDKRLRALAELAERYGITAQWSERKQLDRKAEGTGHQGAVMRVRAPAPRGERELEGLLAETSGPPLLLVLDGVQDPHNLGACLRSAAAAGVDAVIAPRDRACGLTATVRKVASGGAEVVPFFRVTNLARTLRTLQQAGVWLIGADAAGEGTLYDSDLHGPVALVLGAEGQGLRRLTREHCDLLVRIPMPGAVESLNVSVATGVFLFEAVRQRLG